jgi:hypothetical protein
MHLRSSTPTGSSQKLQWRRAWPDTALSAALLAALRRLWLSPRPYAHPLVRYLVSIYGPVSGQDAVTASSSSAVRRSVSPRPASKVQAR